MKSKQRLPRGIATPINDVTVTDDQLAAEMVVAAARSDKVLDGFFEPRTGDYKTTRFVEPFTWAWVAASLAAGALQWVGGQVFGKLFGKRDSIDFAKLVQDFVKAANKVVRRALDERDLRILSMQLDKVRFDLLAYLEAPRGKDRLGFATDNSSGAMFQLKALDLMGHGAFMVSVGLHIAVLQERVRAIDRRDRFTIRRILEDVAIPHAEAMHTAWRRWHESRYTTKNISIHGSIGGMHFTRHWWLLFRDGKEIRREQYVGRGRNREQPQAALMEDLERVWGDVVYPRYVQPSEQIAQKWRGLADSIR